MSSKDILRPLEALLFVSSEPVQMTQIKDALGLGDESVISEAIDTLKQKFESQDSAVRLIEVAGGFRLGTVPDVAQYIKKLVKGGKARLSRASLETLSIVAYRQPITRSEVEAIRGVNVEGALTTLLTRRLIRITGRMETSGRPILYGTTRLFLEHFGLNTLKDLPALSEYSEGDLSQEEREGIKELAKRDMQAGRKADGESAAGDPAKGKGQAG